ncbi:Lipolytic protein G-D-S-L family [Seminavis robusta]|uniref:Lipolytic protein G-D-S-L family n=1 Tax=Seminavis robusta TaxID=568900 RepID=A0A9N8HLR1_9STRA|nr:Lipolytic protein G-D-S-L family [Seminavis robusta]|eukprot:Sro845_g209990.1 Lipolytic protein G-D-S-L family (471) ;mRNA; r:13362-14873
MMPDIWTPTNEQVMAGRSSKRSSGRFVSRVRHAVEEQIGLTFSSNSYGVVVNNDDILFNDSGFQQVNLHDLESYTEQVLQKERRRQRVLWCKVLVGLCALVLVVVAIQGRTVSSDNTTTETPLEKDNAFSVVQEEETKQIHPLTACERDLNHNTSFLQLLHSIQVEDDSGENLVPHCQSRSPKCDWLNPTLPSPRNDKDKTVIEAWNQAIDTHQARIDAIMTKRRQRDLDVAIVGGTLVEHMEGKEYGIAHSHLKRFEDAFLTLFTRLGGGHVDGMALGMTGDRSAHVLYRLHHGTQLLTRDFTPKVWWIMIGTLDWELGVSPRSIVAGIMAIVREIRGVHPSAQIVINSLLPRKEPEDNQSIRRINQLLACYVLSQALIDQEEELQHDDQQNRIIGNDTSTTKKSHHSRRLHFFNATSVFVSKQEDGTYQPNPSLFLPEGNEPDHLGVFAWGQKIVETVLEIIQQQHKS